MKAFSIRGVMLGLAALGMVVPQQSFASAPQQVKTVSSIADVQLVGGQLKGHVVTGHGQSVEGTKVSVSRAGKVVASTVTDAQGEFAIAGLQTGVYQISSVEKSANIRVWEAKVAPQTAKQGVLMVQGDVVRGQLGGLSMMNLAIITTSITGLTVGVIAIDKANDNEDAIDAIPTSP